MPASSSGLGLKNITHFLGKKQKKLLNQKVKNCKKVTIRK